MWIIQEKPHAKMSWSTAWHIAKCSMHVSDSGNGDSGGTDKNENSRK